MQIAVEIDPLMLPWFNAFHREGLLGTTPEETARGLIEEGIRAQMKHAEIRLIDGEDRICRSYTGSAPKK